MTKPESARQSFGEWPNLIAEDRFARIAGKPANH